MISQEQIEINRLNLLSRIDRAIAPDKMTAQQSISLLERLVGDLETRLESLSGTYSVTEDKETGETLYRRRRKLPEISWSKKYDQSEY